MSRTDLKAATLADYLRQMCGDGSVEWCYEPMQTSVLLDMADMLDENARLRKELASVPRCETCDAMLDCDECQRADESHKERRQLERKNAKLRELVHRLISHVEHPPCEGCLAEMNCDGEHVTQCDEWLFMVADARKLGVTE